MSEEDREEIMKEISDLNKKEFLDSHDEFMLGLYNIALRQEWKFNKVEQILDILDMLNANENNHKVEIIKLHLNPLGADDEVISTFFDLFKRVDRYKPLTAVWENK